MQKFWSFSIGLILLSSLLWAQQSRSKEHGHAIAAQESKPAPAAKATPAESADYSQEAFVMEHYIESFRFLIDATDGKPTNQFPGWPVTLQQQENRGENVIG